MKKLTIVSFFIIMIVANTATIFSYPIDGYQWTGIRRLYRLSLILEGKLKGSMPIAGAQKSYHDIKLNLVEDHRIDWSRLPEIDVKLQQEIDALFPNRHESYSLAVLDITPGKPIRFAKRQAERQFSPGSVGKLAIAAGLFNELKTIFPDSTYKRRQLLRNRIVVADRWIHHDHHEVPIFNPDTKAYSFRAVREGDEFSLYEWIDHMLSASANSAASVVWKEAMLMRFFGNDYPPTREQEQEFFEKTSKKTLKEIALSIVKDPLRSIGIIEKDWRLGSFFTSTGKKIVPGEGGSYATPIGFLQFLIILERGKMVDEWSSLEIKRLMYMTAKRIRYASAPALNNAAVYFKSGSLYRCKPEPDFKCGKYMGNVENVMNSIAIIEHPDGKTYLVALMSNVLRKNSAVEHQTIATYIDRILKK
ncbi:MAG TPA: hypothetical protein ENN22_13340 [bacterium]|nr:hypothetical protein [bacterium]